MHAEAISLTRRADWEPTVHMGTKVLRPPHLTVAPTPVKSSARRSILYELHTDIRFVQVEIRNWLTVFPRIVRADVPSPTSPLLSTTSCQRCSLEVGGQNHRRTGQSDVNRTGRLILINDVRPKIIRVSSDIWFWTNRPSVVRFLRRPASPAGRCLDNTSSFVPTCETDSRLWPPLLHICAYHIRELGPLTTAHLSLKTTPMRRLQTLPDIETSLAYKVY